MNYADALNATPLGNLRATLEAGDRMEADQKRRERLGSALHNAGTTQHDGLIDALRMAVYDCDLKNIGKNAAIRGEVDAALCALIKGGAYDDRELARVVGELFAIEGRAASGTAIAGNFTPLEILPANASMTADVASIGTPSQKEEDRKAAEKLAKKLRDTLDKELQAAAAASESQPARL